MASYVVNTRKQQQLMLRELKLETLDDLFVDVPESVRLESLNIPQGQSELEVYHEMSEISSKILFLNISFGEVELIIIIFLQSSMLLSVKKNF